MQGNLRFKDLEILDQFADLPVLRRQFGVGVLHQRIVFMIVLVAPRARLSCRLIIRLQNPVANNKIQWLRNIFLMLRQNSNATDKQL